MDDRARALRSCGVGLVTPGPSSSLTSSYSSFVSAASSSNSPVSRIFAASSRVTADDPRPDRFVEQTGNDAAVEHPSR